MVQGLSAHITAIYCINFRVQLFLLHYFNDYFFLCSLFYGQHRRRLGLLLPKAVFIICLFGHLNLQFIIKFLCQLAGWLKSWPHLIFRPAGVMVILVALAFDVLSGHVVVIF